VSNGPHTSYQQNQQNTCIQGCPGLAHHTTGLSVFFIRAPDTTQLTVCFTMTPCGMTINDMVCLTVVSCSLLTIPVLLHIRVGSSVVVLFKLVITCIRSALACTSEVMACL
jgi:hypothetical protein